MSTESAIMLNTKTGGVLKFTAANLKGITECFKDGVRHTAVILDDYIVGDSTLRYVTEDMPRIVSLLTHSAIHFNRSIPDSFVCDPDGALRPGPHRIAMLDASIQAIGSRLAEMDGDESEKTCAYRKTLDDFMNRIIHERHCVENILEHSTPMTLSDLKAMQVQFVGDNAPHIFTRAFNTQASGKLDGPHLEYWREGDAPKRFIQALSVIERVLELA